MAIYRIDNDTPRVAASAWVADSAQVMGNVELHEDANIWFAAVLRGDTARIRRSAALERAGRQHRPFGLRLSDHARRRVTVGHQVMLHGCTIGDGSLIGIQSVVLNGARIGRHCLVGAGSLVTEGKEFPGRLADRRLAGAARSVR